MMRLFDSDLEANSFAMSQFEDRFDGMSSDSPRYAAADEPTYRSRSHHPLAKAPQTDEADPPTWAKSHPRHERLQPTLQKQPASDEHDALTVDPERDAREQRHSAAPNHNAPNGSNGSNGSNGNTNGNGIGVKPQQSAIATRDQQTDAAAATQDQQTDATDAEPHPDDEQEQGFLPVLRNANFLTLWGGQVFSQVADKVYLVLMIALIASRFQAADQSISGWVSSLMITFTIPAILFGSVAGVFVDHWSKRTVLVATNLLRGGFVLGIPLLLWLFQGWQGFAGIPVGFFALLGITFLVSTLTQFFAPAEQAVLPLIVERKHLLSANSLYTTTMMASVIVGFALGEPVLAIAGSIGNWLHLGSDLGKELLVGGSYAIAGLLLMLLKTNEKAEDSLEDLPPVWENIRDGLRYLGQKRQVRAAMIQLVILFSIFAALAVLAVRLAEVMPAIKSSQFGFLLAAGGVGMALGAFLLGQFGQRFSRAQLSLIGSVGVGVALGTLSLTTHQLWVTLLLLFLLGAFAAIVGIPMQTTIQAETPEEMRGKVFGLQNNAVNIALSLPLALAGVAETLFGLQAVFLSLAALAIAGGIFTWSISRTGSREGV